MSLCSCKHGQHGKTCGMVLRVAQMTPKKRPFKTASPVDVFQSGKESDKKKIAAAEACQAARYSRGVTLRQ